jgi:hypothetical protein
MEASRLGSTDRFCHGAARRCEASIGCRATTARKHTAPDSSAP